MNMIKLWPESRHESGIKPYLLDDGIPHPAILVIPGGGYGGVCEATEGGPVARRFNALGFHAFVLNYRVAPRRFPEPQLDAMRAMRMIRFNADKWGVIADNVAVCGFSAGGHLAACLGTIAVDIPTDGSDPVDQCNCRPDAMLLCYGVLSFASWSHQGTVNNLLGEESERLRDDFSLELQIRPDTPPAFVWHTAEDQMVPYRNSLVFAEAMWEQQCTCELHVFPQGPHGMQLGYGREDITVWPELARAFLHGTCGFRFPERGRTRTVVLTFDDASKSHLTNVAPLLNRYGFGATFFISRFNADWRSKHEPKLMTKNEVRQLAGMGFEIGNHTLNHPDLRKLSGEDIRMEIRALDEWLDSCEIKNAESFAYPGGPFAENAVPELQDHGFSLARTTELRAWDKKIDSPFRVPAFPLQKDDELAFYRALQYCRDDNAVVLVFHGVPDEVHDFVSTSEAFFKKCMKYLYDNDYTVLSMIDYFNK